MFQKNTFPVFTGLWKEGEQAPKLSWAVKEGQRFELHVLDPGQRVRSVMVEKRLGEKHFFEKHILLC